MATALGQRIVDNANRWLGTMYDWGGSGLDGNGVDCSGLVIAAYRDAGVPLGGRPRAVDLGRFGTAVPLAKAAPGDVVYFDEPGDTDHVGIFLGGGKMIDSPTQGQRVGVHNVGKFTSIRHIVDTGSTAPGGFIPGSDANTSSGAIDDVTDAVASAFNGLSGTASRIAIYAVAGLTVGALVVAGATQTVRGGQA